MKKLLILSFIIVLCSCSSTKKVSTEQTDFLKIVSEQKEMISRFEKSLEIYKDSLMLVKALKEKSSNVGDSFSHLETSYSYSDALIRNGKLHHSIENKDSIEVPVKLIYRDVAVHDTIRVNTIDTIYVDRKQVRKEVKQVDRFCGTFFYTSGWILWGVIIVGGGVWFLYKVKLGKK